MAAKLIEKDCPTLEQGYHVIDLICREPRGKYSRELKRHCKKKGEEKPLRALKYLLKHAELQLAEDVTTHSATEKIIPSTFDESDLHQIMLCIKASLGSDTNLIPDETWIRTSAAAFGYSSKHAIPLTNWLLVDEINSLEDSKAMIAAAMQMVFVLRSIHVGESSVDWSPKSGSECDHTTYWKYLCLMRQRASDAFAVGKSENAGSPSELDACPDPTNDRSHDRPSNERKRKADQSPEPRRSQRLRSRIS